MEKKYVKVSQEVGEDVFKYIKRLETMQKTASDDIVYYGKYYDSKNDDSFLFEGANLPKLTPNVEYRYLDAFDLLKYDVPNTMEAIRNKLIEVRENNDQTYIYTYFAQTGFISSDELLACSNIKEIEALFKEKMEQKDRLKFEWVRIDEKERKQMELNEENQFVKDQKAGVELLKLANELGEKLSDRQIAAILLSIERFCVRENNENDFVDVKGNPVLASEEFEEFMTMLSERFEPDDMGYGNPQGELFRTVDSVGIRIRERTWKR